MGLQRVKEHHLVPMFWLREFAEAGHLVGRQRDGREHGTPVRGAAKARNFNTDPLSQGEQRVALETYLAEKVDDRAARVVRSVRDGVWPLAAADQNTLLRALGWQLVRTQMFRSWNGQVGAHLAPVVWAQSRSFGQRIAGPLPLGSSTMPGGICGPLSVLWPLHRPTWSPRSGTWCWCRPNAHAWWWEVPVWSSGAPAGLTSIAPPLLGAATELFAPVSPTHLLISTRTPERYRGSALTPEIARPANKGAAAWCQSAVYRLPSMRWPRYLRLAPSPPLIPAPRIAPASPGTQEGDDAYRPVQNDPELLDLLKQFGTDG